MSTKPKPSKIILVNPNTAGVVYDREGHNLGGGEPVEVDALDDVGQLAVDNGQLIIRNGASHQD
jgi:hypothetical protein